MKRKTKITIIVLLILIITSFFIPIKNVEYIKIKNPTDNGGPVYKKGYNIYGVKLYDMRRF